MVMMKKTKHTVTSLLVCLVIIVYLTCKGPPGPNGQPNKYQIIINKGHTILNTIV